MVWLFVRGEDVSSQKLYFQCTAPGRFASAYGFIIHISPALKAPNQGILLLFYIHTYDRARQSSYIAPSLFFQQ